MDARWPIIVAAGVVAVGSVGALGALASGGCRGSDLGAHPGAPTSPSASASNVASSVASSASSCDVVLAPFGGPRKVRLDGSKRYCVGDVRVPDMPEPEYRSTLPSGCTYTMPVGAYVLRCPGFRATGGGPIANFDTIELDPPAASASASAR